MSAIVSESISKEFNDQIKQPLMKYKLQDLIKYARRADYDTIL